MENTSIFVGATSTDTATKYNLGRTGAAVRDFNKLDVSLKLYMR